MRSSGSCEFLEKLGLGGMMQSKKIEITADFILGGNIKAKTGTESKNTLKRVCLILRMPGRGIDHTI